VVFRPGAPDVSDATAGDEAGPRGLGVSSLVRPLFAPRLPALALLAGCGGAGFDQLGPPSGASGVLVRAPCAAGKLVLYDGFRLACSYYPPEPEYDTTFWSAERPCKRTVEYLVLDPPAPVVTSYDYSNTAYAGASYLASGNIGSWSLAAAGLGGPGIVDYDYDGGGALIGARVRSSTDSVVYRNEGGHRVAEQSGNAEYDYTYAGGRLVAEGWPVEGAPPEPLPLESVSPDAAGHLPTVPASGGVAARSYYYDDHGRLSSVVIGEVPSLPFRRIDLQYQGGHLVTVTDAAPRDYGVSSDPDQLPQRWTYGYDCS
jgi:hypothetical protein